MPARAGYCLIRGAVAVRAQRRATVALARRRSVGVAPSWHTGDARTTVAGGAQRPDARGRLRLMPSAAPCRCASTTAAPTPAYRVFSGIQPTGVPHLGNYLGALVNWVALQDSANAAAAAADGSADASPTPAAAASRDSRGLGRVLYSIVDLHAITVPHDAAELPKACREVAATLLACGVDPTVSIVFRQSAVMEHSELAWILGCVTPMGWLNRMTQFKDKSASGGASNAGLGLYSYPVLQAADILLYKATAVPVGDDQRQHLELARDIATSFNTRFGAGLLPLPEAIVPDGQVNRVMSLRDGTKKMSKSDVSDLSRINLVDDADAIRKKINKATTDAIEGITFDTEARPGVANLLAIHAALESRTPAEVAADFETAQTSALKRSLIELLVERVCPIGEEIARLLQEADYLDETLLAGEAHARDIARATMRDVKDAVGLTLNHH